jgi:hypothetical protein
MKEVGEYFGCMKQSFRPVKILAHGWTSLSALLWQGIFPRVQSLSPERPFAFPGLSARCSFPRQLLVYPIALLAELRGYHFAWAS